MTAASAPRHPWSWLLALALGTVAMAQPLRKYSNTVGMTSAGFDGVNVNDAKAAFRVLNMEIGKKYGYDLSPEIYSFDTTAEFAAAIRSGRISTAVCGAWELFDADCLDEIDVKFVTVIGGVTAFRWLLLVRQDSPFHELADLRGRRAAVLYNSSAMLGLPWLETSLLEAGLPDSTAFFSRYERAPKPATAILPVFFGKLDACLVTEGAFKVMSEMNPEVGRQLRVLTQSEPMANGVLAFNHRGWDAGDVRADLERAMRELHQDASGRQLLSLFKCDRIEPYAPGMLDSVARLHRRHRELTETRKP